MTTIIVGLDLATQARKTGFAHGHYDGKTVDLSQAGMGSDAQQVSQYGSSVPSATRYELGGARR